MVSRCRSEGHLGRSRPRCTGPVQRNIRSRGGGSVSSALHTYGLVSVSPGCFQHCSPLPQLGLLCQQLAGLLLHGLQLQLHRMKLEMCPHLHSKIDINLPLKQVIVKKWYMCVNRVLAVLVAAAMLMGSVSDNRNANEQR